jgi:hypothetical protein
LHTGGANTFLWSRIMGVQNTVSADLGADQVAQDQAQLRGLETSLLPFLLGLSQEERKEPLRVDAPHI